MICLAWLDDLYFRFSVCPHVDLQTTYVRMSSSPPPPPPPPPPASQLPSKPLQYLDLASNVALFANMGNPRHHRHHNHNDRQHHRQAQQQADEEEEEDPSLPLIQDFCTALAYNTRLTGLYLRNCGITGPALCAIARACCRNTTLRVLDVRQLALVPAAAGANGTGTGGFPPAVLDSITQWKGIETLELDYAFTDVTEATALVQALQQNTSLVSGHLVLPPNDNGHRAAVQAVFTRNRWWKRARELLADHHPAIYDSSGGVWMHALARFGSGNRTTVANTGATAAYFTLRERLSLWLENAAADDTQEILSQS